MTVLVVTLGLLCTGLGQAAATSDAERRLKETQSSLARAQDELAESTQALADATAAYQAATAQLPGAEATLATAQQGLAAAEHELEVARGEVAAARAADEAAAQRLAEAEQKVADQVAKIDDVTERIDGKRASISQVAVQAYTRGVGADLASLTILMQAESMDELAASAAASTSVLTAENSIMSDLKDDRAELANERVILEDLEAAAEGARQLAAETLQTTEQREQQAEQARASAQAAADAAAQAKAQVDQLVAARDGAVSAAHAAQAEDQAQTAQWSAERDQIEAEIAEIQRRQAEQEAAEQEQAEQDSGGSGGGGSVTLAFPTANPYVTSPYGMRVHPVTGVYKLHDGTDFRAYCGTPIRAAAAGTVEWAYYRGAYGNQVAVASRSMVTTYSHLSRFAVGDGERVSQGEVIGYSGTTGSSTACHLHFMLYVNGERVNPMNYLGR
ncbi:M23 family metallopeptidase [Jiangella anatolica]|uniref:M23ase beta-sheet core domain-containing protein n=1 Tax=Jiangella anatolica TaxID=2670374 RepID=A0A2W2C5U2_9ACTN|nr:M23 family metallopeptidase [Jiangella anatolica]PZF81116.1 hypothetical protein C1I92_22715 [Jiangella anatolica]